jgi:iron only hydrogenase large subunit-like protein
VLVLRTVCPFPAGVHYVFDMTIAADFSILESQKEFVRRYHQHSEEQRALPMLTSACPGKPRTTGLWPAEPSRAMGAGMGPG